jgi:serine/threonine protein phosphatase PrpC
MSVVFAARTHRGCRRRQNEDEVLVRQGLGSNGVWVLLAVADGMGGAAEGGRASREAIRILGLELERWSDGAPADTLRGAFETANRFLVDLGNRRRSHRGMGTTLVAALTDGSQAWVANVGDSRAYHIDGDLIRQLTEDHSLVAEQVRAGYLDEGAAAASPHKNIITRSLGHSAALRVDVFGPVELHAGEALLLCSDGLYSVVAESEVAAHAIAFEPEEAAGRLIALANERGAPDNVSVVLARLD